MNERTKENSTVSLQLSIEEALETCKSLLRSYHFDVTQVGFQQLIGIRKSDGASVVFKLTISDDKQTTLVVENPCQSSWIRPTASRARSAMDVGFRGLQILNVA